MANLSETVVWEPGIYQWELTDPVQGGPDGIDNVPTRQLANRTAYLKQEVELRAPLNSPALTGTPTAPTPAGGTNTTQVATSAFVNSAIDTAVNLIMNAPPEALDTLNELAAALGDDPSFATTVTESIGAVQAELTAHQALNADVGQIGHIAIATAAAVIAGLETDTAVTPATLNHIIQTRAAFTADLSAPVAPTSGVLTTLSTLTPDSGNMDAHISGGVLTIPAEMEGVWAFTAVAQWNTTSRNPYAAIIHNGTVAALGSRPNSDQNTYFTMSTTGAILPLVEGDTISIAVFTSIGGCQVGAGNFHGARVSL